MVIKYPNIFHSKAHQNVPEFGIFGFKLYHLATLKYIPETDATEKHELVYQKTEWNLI
jgi:hypothetical protein